MGFPIDANVPRPVLPGPPWGTACLQKAGQQSNPIDPMLQRQTDDA